jgi:hypothetical protein
MLLALQRRYGLWLCYLLYFLLSLILPVNVDRLVTLALPLTLVLPTCTWVCTPP